MIFACNLLLVARMAMFFVVLKNLCLAISYSVNKTLKIFDRFPLWLLVFFCFLAYGNSLGNSFSYDDEFTITKNAFIQHPEKRSALFSRDYFSISGEESFRPIVTLTQIFNYAMNGLHPFGYHLFNIALHLCNGILLYSCVFLISGSKRQSLAIALLFLLFPVNTEAVNAISFREDLLVTFFGLFGFQLFLTSLNDSGQRYLGWSAAFTFLAMLSKENGLVLPFLFLGYDLFFQGKPSSEVFWKRYSPFLFCLFGFIFFRFILFTNPLAKPLPFLGGSFLAAVSLVPYAFCSSLRLWIFPYPLSADYPAIDSQPIAWTIMAITGALFLGSVWLIFFLRKRDPIAGFGFFWILLCFLPTSNLVPLMQTFAERYLYLPGIGFLVVLVRGLRHCLPIRLLKIVLGSLAILYLGLTIHRNADWQNNSALWETTLRQNPTSLRALNNLGIERLREGNIQESLRLLDQAVQLGANADIFGNRGKAHLAANNLPAALADLNRAIELQEKKPAFWQNRGIVHGLLGQFDASIADFNRLIELSPDDPEAFRNRGITFQSMGKNLEAARDFQKARDLQNSRNQS